MIIRNATQVGNPVIRAKAKPVPVKDIGSKETKRIVQNLTDSMRHHDLVGMAAPQIGIGARIFVSEIRITKFRKDLNNTDPLRVFINPKITSRSTKTAKGWEGCGSVVSGELFGKVTRPAKVTVTAYNEHGEKFELVATDLLARIIQHEVDHLDGKLFIDTADTKTYGVKDELLKQSKKAK